MKSEHTQKPLNFEASINPQMMYDGRHLRDAIVHQGEVPKSIFGTVSHFLDNSLSFPFLEGRQPPEEITPFV